MALAIPSESNCAAAAARTARLGRWWLSRCLLLASLLLGSSLPWRLGPRPAESAPAVAQPDRPRTQEIETIRVGQRVVARNPQPEAVPRTTAEVDPTTWRLLRLRAESRWPDGTLDVIHVETLQPAEWIEKHNALVGAAVPLPFDLLEMGLPKDLHARVVANEPCPPIAAGPGSVVLTTVNHLNPDAYSLALVDAEGRGETVRPTGCHKFYSANRGRWVNTEELKPGERLRGIDGWLTVTDVRRLPGVHRVYNMTVAGEHVFHVSRLGLVSHNNNPCAQAVPTVPKQGIYEFPDAAAAGKPYVGQSGNIPQRLQQHQQAGRLTEGTVPRTTEIPGGKTAREIAEHQRIQELTGGVPARHSPNVANQRDPIGPNRRHLLGDQ